MEFKVQDEKSSGVYCGVSAFDYVESSCEEPVATCIRGFMSIGHIKFHLGNEDVAKNKTLCPTCVATLF